MNDQVKRFEQVQVECLALYKQKNERYGNSFERTLDEWDSLIPIGLRLSDKMSRLQEILKDPSLATSDESLRDTLVDIANYATMSVSYLDSKAGTEQV